MTPTRTSLLLLVGAACFPLSPRCEAQVSTRPEASREAVTAVALVDAPLAAYQGDLLDIAFTSVSAMPLQPHIRNRSRGQEAVASVCIQLDQPRRALAYIEKIDDWRRGAGYADLAYYSAQHGNTVDVQHLMDRAALIANTAEDWSRDYIRVRLARTYAWMGQAEKAESLEADLIPAEAGKVASVRAMLSTPEMFSVQIDALDRLMASSDFDRVRNALDACTQLFNRFCDDKDRRDIAESRIKSGWSKVPISIRIDLLSSLAGFALEHQDQAKALMLANEAQALVDGYAWETNDHIAMMGRVAGLRARAGDLAGARAEVEQALALFASDRQRITDINRPDALRPVAEAFQDMGDTAGALKIYKQVIEEGVANPNSRPRADDLSATCCSMALHKVEPDAELWKRIRQINGGLGQPW